jgi:hypothetical protein
MRSSSWLRFVVGVGLLALGFGLGQAASGAAPSFTWWGDESSVVVELDAAASPGTAYWVVASAGPAPVPAQPGWESLAMLEDRPGLLKISSSEVQSLLLYRLVPEAMLVRAEPLSPWTLRPCQSEVCPIPLPPPPPIRGFEAGPGNLDPLTRGFLLHN